MQQTIYLMKLFNKKLYISLLRSIIKNDLCSVKEILDKDLNLHDFYLFRMSLLKNIYNKTLAFHEFFNNTNIDIIFLMLNKFNFNIIDNDKYIYSELFRLTIFHSRVIPKSKKIEFFNLLIDKFTQHNEISIDFLKESIHIRDITLFRLLLKNFNCSNKHVMLHLFNSCIAIEDHRFFLHVFNLEILDHILIQQEILMLSNLINNFDLFYFNHVIRHKNINLSTQDNRLLLECFFKNNEIGYQRLLQDKEVFNTAINLGIENILNKTHFRHDKKNYELNHYPKFVELFNTFKKIKNF